MEKQTFISLYLHAKLFISRNEIRSILNEVKKTSKTFRKKEFVRVQSSISKMELIGGYGLSSYTNEIQTCFSPRVNNLIFIILFLNEILCLWKGMF